MKYKQNNKIVNFLEYVYLCAKRQYLLEKEGSEALAEVKEYDNKTISTMEDNVKENMDVLTYLTLLKAKKALEDNCSSTDCLHIGYNVYDKNMQDITVVGNTGNIFTIHVLQNGRITVAGELNIPMQTGYGVNSTEISEYVLILGNYLRSYLQGNDQQDMYLSILDTVKTIERYLYTFGTPRFKELTEYTAFVMSLIMECDKFFPCNVEYRKGLIVLEEEDDDSYYVYLKSIDKMCTIIYNSDNHSLSFSLSALDE